jgi:hypothetical protein
MGTIDSHDLLFLSIVRQSVLHRGIVTVFQIVCNTRADRIKIDIDHAGQD